MPEPSATEPVATEPSATVDQTSPTPAFLLASDEDGRDILVEDGPDGAVRLPALDPIGEPERHPAVAAAVASRLAQPHPVLRILNVRRAPEAYLVQIGPIHRDDPGIGDARWLAADLADPTELLGDGPAREALQRWLRDVRTGSVDPRRQSWAIPGAQARAAAWALDRLAEVGTPATVDPELLQVWGISAVWRIPTAVGPAYLKACARVFHGEPAISAALATLVPGSTPEVVAIDPAEGWLLMREAPGTELGDEPIERWPSGIAALARIQRAWAADPPIDLEDRGPEAAATALDALLDGRERSWLPDDLRDRLAAVRTELLDACGRLAGSELPRTIVHGDLHPGNVHRDGDRLTILDWSDSACGHPFQDLAPYLLRTKVASERRAIIDAAIVAWSDRVDPIRLETETQAALVVGALHQVEGYRRIAASLEPDDDWDIVGGVVGWARWTVAFLQDGLEATVDR